MVPGLTRTVQLLTEVALEARLTLTALVTVTHSMSRAQDIAGSALVAGVTPADGAEGRVLRTMDAGQFTLLTHGVITVDTARRVIGHTITRP